MKHRKVILKLTPKDYLAVVGALTVMKLDPSVVKTKKGQYERIIDSIQLQRAEQRVI